jgi:putative iron-regulated protein
MLSLFRKILVLSCAVLTLPSFAVSPTKTAEQAVVAHYADIAHEVFSDAYTSALQLQSFVKSFTQKPDAEGLTAAQQAWITARIPYQQSEAYRFGNPVVDAWEGQLNNWPLDEGLIDYVNDDDYFYALGNIGASLNIIANPIIDLGGETLDSSTINPELLRSLHELGGSAANVATGYHAIEFLLWGQDLHGHELGAGERPYTDYLIGPGCTHGHCDRRAAYLLAATELLVSDLKYMVAQWTPSIANNYRADLLAQSSSVGLARMFNGLGSLSLGELGGERIKVSLEANSTEDEHDCFSDNTHWSHYYDGLGIENVYLGRYRRMDGSLLSGPSLSDLVRKAQPDVDSKTRAALSKTMTALKVLADSAEAKTDTMKFDMMIAQGNNRGEEILGNILKALAAQTNAIESAAKSLAINPSATGN